MADGYSNYESNTMVDSESDAPAAPAPPSPAAAGGDRAVHIQQYQFDPMDQPEVQFASFELSRSNLNT